jgi:hypothetical protein
MATTRLTDVIYGPTFLPTVVNRITGQSAIRQSGLVIDDPRVQQMADSVGDIVQMPFWNDITGDSNVSSDDPAQNATPNKITMGTDYARKLRRNNGWQSANLVASLLQEDPLDVIAGLIADYWVREEQKILGFVLTGIFAAASMAGNLLNVASEAGATTPVNMDTTVSANAHALLGDKGISLRAVMMHSRIFWNLRNQGHITYGLNPVGQPDLDMPFWDGKRVLVSDALPNRNGTTSGKVYTSYFFGEGAIGYAEARGDGGPKKPVEEDAAPSAGNGEGVDTVWHRRHFIMHVRGVSFTSASVAGASPTNAELAAAANWNRVWDPKDIRVVAVTTNG